MIRKIVLMVAAAACWTNASAVSSRHSNNPGSNPEYWWLCPVDRSLPSRPDYTDLKIDVANTEVRAGQSRAVEDDITDFDDGVELVRNKLALRADHLSYDEPADAARAFGDVHLWDADLLWRGQRAQFDLGNEIYKLDGGEYWLLGSPGRGAAQSIVAKNKTHRTVLKNVDYTTCPAGNEAWKFSATRIKLDHDGERGYATNALLKVRGVPIFYFPYASFPLSGKRKSGFLIPTIGSSSTEGFETRIPYYFNIAPNQDATLSPHWLSRRGLMMEGEYRYLGEGIKSTLRLSYLPDDPLKDGNDRSSVSLRHEQYFDEYHGRVYALLQNVSDSRYFEDFGGSLSLSSQRYLDRRIETTYRRDGYAINALFQAFQSIDETIPDALLPYRRLPQIVARTTFPMRHLQPHFQMLGDFTYFSRTDSVSGERIGLEPTLSLPFIKPWLFVRPAVGLRRTDYFLTDYEGRFPSNPSRMAPVFTTDAQFFAERRFEFADMRLLQTLEPRAYYVNIPKVGQDDIPVFDSGVYDFSFANLFRENRFSGRDRLGDANQLALALTSRFMNLGNGREILRTSIGQIQYFKSRRITLPGRAADDSSESELVAEVASSPVEDWTARVTLQWDPDTEETEKSAFSVRYAPADGTLVNAAYRLRGNVNRTVTTLFTRPKDVEQTDISLRLPLTENLNFIGRWNYSLQGEESLELVGGIELETCCWGVRVFSRRYIRNVEGKFDNAVFMQVELKGLGGLGRTATSFLKRNIPGYEPLF